MLCGEQLVDAVDGVGVEAGKLSQASKQAVTAAQNKVVAVEPGQEGRFRIDFEGTART